MLRLTMQRESRWIDAAGARVKIKPLTTAIITAAKSEAFKRLAAAQAEAEAQEKAGFAPLYGSANLRAGLIEQYVAEALLRYAAEEWEGVCDEAGATLPLGDGAYDALAAHEPFAREFLNAAFAQLDAVSAEGNASAPSWPGAGEGAATTAPDADQSPAPHAPPS